MSYNLYAEGDLDYFALSCEAQRCTGIELFPITGDGGPDALGIALPSTHVDDNAIAELDALIRKLLAADVKVVDLMSGECIAHLSDLTALTQRITGLDRHP